METCKRSYERFCPVVGKNVMVEESLRDGNTQITCMHSPNCEANGGCKNRFFAQPR